MKKTAFIYPGQASQYVGMARDLYESFESVKDIFKKASEILEYDLADVCFNGPEEKLKQTAFTQPAVFVHSCAIDTILRENDFRPDAAAGHSLGEYSALVSSGALDFGSGIRAVAIRSRKMQKDCDDNPGTMAAVMGLDFDIVEQTLKQIDGIAVPANYNSRGQVVIAGEKDAIDKACIALKAAGAKRAILIPVGGAYHSPLMSISSEFMKRYILEEMNFNRFDFPVYANVSAKPASDIEEYKSLLARQITSPVLWNQTITNMYNDGIREFIEVGPGKVLQGLVKKSLDDSEVVIRGIETADQLQEFLKEKVVSA